MKHSKTWAALASGLALAFGATKAIETEKVRIVERETLSAQQIYDREPVRHTETHQLLLTVAYFSDGSWPRVEALAATRDAAQILAQCDVLLPGLEVVRIDAPARYRYFNTPISRQLASTLQLSKPTVYFVDDTHQQPAFDAEAIGRGNSKSRPELTDTVWVTRATRDVGIALAHELVHVLMNSGAHVDRAGNLMRDRTTPKNTQLTSEQCTQLRNVGTRNGLLQTR